MKNRVATISLSQLCERCIHGTMDFPNYGVSCDQNRQVLFQAPSRPIDRANTQSWGHVPVIQPCPGYRTIFMAQPPRVSPVKNKKKHVPWDRPNRYRRKKHGGDSTYHPAGITIERPRPALEASQSGSARLVPREDLGGLDAMKAKKDVWFLMIKGFSIACDVVLGRPAAPHAYRCTRSFNPALWSDPANRGDKTDRRPVVTRERNRAAQMAHRNVGVNTRIPGYPDTGDGAVVPRKADRNQDPMELQREPGLL